jgi:hypothetical protein
METAFTPPLSFSYFKEGFLHKFFLYASVAEPHHFYASLALSRRIAHAPALDLARLLKGHSHEKSL